MRREVKKVNMEKILEKTVKCYVIAGISDNYCWYLKANRHIVSDQLVAHVKYEMTTDIERADKYASKSIAKTILEDYKQLCKDDVDLVIIPLEIDYNLIKEI